MKPEQRLDRIEKAIEKQNESIQKLIESDEKQNEAARALIVVARTCLDSIKEMRANHDSDHRQVLAEIKQTDEKLNILITTVDRLIGHRPE